MAELLLHTFLPALCLLLAKVHRKPSRFAEHTLGALLTTVAATHRLLTPFSAFCCLLLRAQPPSEKPSQPPPLCSCLSRGADGTWVTGGSLRAATVLSPTGNGKGWEGS